MLIRCRRIDQKRSFLYFSSSSLKSEGINSEDIFFGRSGTLIVHPLIGLTSILHTNKPKQTTGQEIVDAGSSGQNAQTENMPSLGEYQAGTEKWIGLWKWPFKDDGIGLEGLGDCKALTNLNISFCKKLEKLPESKNTIH